MVRTRLFGLDGADQIFGGNGTDFLDGGEGPDQLFGGNGKDILIGGLGDDELTGGRGDDTFMFALGEGTDTVLDYEIGKDLIGLDGLAYGDLSIGQAGDDATIVANGELLAILAGVESLWPVPKRTSSTSRETKLFHAENVRCIRPATGNILTSRLKHIVGCHARAFSDHSLIPISKIRQSLRNDWSA